MLLIVRVPNEFEYPITLSDVICGVEKAKAKVKALWSPALAAKNYEPVPTMENHLADGGAGAAEKKRRHYAFGKDRKKKKN